MANCPKCGRHLKLTDISQYCPGCGVNMRFYGFEQNFYTEAKKAELTQAGYHVKIRRLKAAFLGSKLTIARLIVVLLPVAALLIPSGSYSFTLPLKTASADFSILGFIGLFTGSDLGYIGTMKNSELFGSQFSALQTAVFGYMSVAVIAVIALLLTILCFISYKNMQKIIAVTAALGIADCIAAYILIASFAKKASGGFLSGKAGFGMFVEMLMFAVVFAVNFLLIKKGIPVEYDEGMLERVEIYKKVKAGEIDLDDLPQPVVETAETRKIDEEIAKEEEAFRKKHAANAKEA